MSRYGAPTFSSLLNSCVLWAPLQHSAGVSGDIDEFPILPSGVTVTNNGTFTKTDLGNNKSVLNFDGSTNYISLSDNDAWDFWNSNFTLMIWFYPTEMTTMDRPIITQDEGTLNNYSKIYFAPNSNILEIHRIKDGVVSTYCRITYTPSVYNWVNVCIQRSDSTCLMYINGVSQTVSGDQIFLTNVSLSAPLIIGKNPNYVYGSFKDLMIFNRALTQAEIKLLMNRTHPITGAGLMPVNGEYWRTS